MSNRTKWRHLTEIQTKNMPCNCNRMVTEICKRILYGRYPERSVSDSDGQETESIRYHYYVCDPSHTRTPLLSPQDPTVMQLITGGASFTACEIHCKLSAIFLFTHYVLIGVLAYADSYTALVDSLSEHFETVDQSGSIASVISTFILMLGYFIFSLVWMPAFIVNNTHASFNLSFISFLYYLFLAGLWTWFLSYKHSRAKEDQTEAASWVTIYFLVLNSGCVVINIFSCCFSLALRKREPAKSYWLNRLHAFRWYTFSRLNGLGREVLLLPSRKTSDGSELNQNSSIFNNTSSFVLRLTRTEPSILDKRSWKQKTSLERLRSVWIPRTQAFKVVDNLFELPLTLVAAINLAVVIVVLIAINVVPNATDLRDLIDDYIDEYENSLIAIAAANVSTGPEYSILTTTTEFLENRLEFWQGIRDPIFLSVVIGSYLGLIWTASFIPSAAYGFKVAILELRIGIYDGPGFASKSRQEEFPPWKSSALIGCYVSTSVFAWLVSTLMFFLLMMLFLWPPFWDFIWSINYLWLPACVSIIVQTIFNKTWGGIFFLTDTYKKRINTPDEIIVFEPKTSYTLVKPKSYVFLEYTLLFAYLPLYAWAGFMRCIYGFLVALLGVMRVDWTFLPTGVHTLDAAWVAFSAEALRSNTFANPIFWVAVEMFRSNHGSHNCIYNRTKAYRRVRNRFWLALLLSKYPFLLSLRRSRRWPIIAEQDDNVNAESDMKSIPDFVAS